MKAHSGGPVVFMLGRSKVGDICDSAIVKPRIIVYPGTYHLDIKIIYNSKVKTAK